DNPYTFTGRRLDDETLLMYYRARTYNSLEGRFKQLDPVGFTEDWNLFEYVASQPLQRTDPTGHQAAPASKTVMAPACCTYCWTCSPIFLGCFRDLQTGCESPQLIAYSASIHSNGTVILTPRNACESRRPNNSLYCS